MNCPRNERGLSLIELMVAMALGLIITAGILNIVLGGSLTNARLQDAASLTENGRYASALLHDEIQMAGFYGLLDEYDATVATLPNPCTISDTALRSGMPLPVQGYNNVGVSGTGNDASSVINACLPSGDSVLAGTDILITRRAGTQLVTGSLSASSYYLQASNLAYVLDLGNGTFGLTKKDGTTAEDIRLYRQFVYYVNQNRDLVRLELTGGGYTAVPIASGVEDFQVEYGIDRSDNGAPNESASGVGDDYVQKPASIDDWKNVVSIKTHLLLRIDATGAHTDTKTYNLGLKGDLGPYNDGFKRRLFQSGNRIINVSMKREEA